MRPIHLARLDKTRPVLVLTREAARSSLTKVTVATITSTVRGIQSEVPVGIHHGLESASAVSCDNIMTIPVSDLGRQIGRLRFEDEAALARALILAFDLSAEELP